MFGKNAEYVYTIYKAAQTRSSPEQVREHGKRTEDMFDHSPSAYAHAIRALRAGDAG